MDRPSSVFFCGTPDKTFTNYEKQKYLAFHPVQDKTEKIIICNKVFYRNTYAKKLGLGERCLGSVVLILIYNIPVDRIVLTDRYRFTFPKLYTLIPTQNMLTVKLWSSRRLTTSSKLYVRSFILSQQVRYPEPFQLVCWYLVIPLIGQFSHSILILPSYPFFRSVLQVFKLQNVWGLRAPSLHNKFVQS